MVTAPQCLPVACKGVAYVSGVHIHGYLSIVSSCRSFGVHIHGYHCIASTSGMSGGRVECISMSTAPK